MSAVLNIIQPLYYFFNLTSNEIQRGISSVFDFDFTWSYGGSESSCEEKRLTPFTDALGVQLDKIVDKVPRISIVYLNWSGVVTLTAADVGDLVKGPM